MFEIPKGGIPLTSRLWVAILDMVVQVLIFADALSGLRIKWVFVLRCPFHTVLFEPHRRAMPCGQHIKLPMSSQVILLGFNENMRMKFVWIHNNSLWELWSSFCYAQLYALRTAFPCTDLRSFGRLSTRDVPDSSFARTRGHKWCISPTISWFVNPILPTAKNGCNTWTTKSRSDFGDWGGRQYVVRIMHNLLKLN